MLAKTQPEIRLLTLKIKNPNSLNIALEQLKLNGKKEFGSRSEKCRKVHSTKMNKIFEYENNYQSTSYVKINITLLKRRHAHTAGMICMNVANR